MSRTRRCLLAALALTIAFVLFRGQLATAVVTRGDDALRLGDAAGALRFYRRAMAIDRHSGTAADRFAFTLGMRHDRPSAMLAIAAVTRAIDDGANDPALYADRAFAEVQLRRWSAAERDFAAAGNAARDARYHHFAARMALHAGDRPAARRFTRLALADDPAFAPARAFARTLR